MKVDIFKENFYEKIYYEITEETKLTSIDKIYLKANKIKTELDTFDINQLRLIKSHANSFQSGLNVTSSLVLPLIGFLISILIIYLSYLAKDNAGNIIIYLIAFIIWPTILFFLIRAIEKFTTRSFCATFISEIIDVCIKEKEAETQK